MRASAPGRLGPAIEMLPDVRATPSTEASLACVDIDLLELPRLSWSEMACCLFAMLPLSGATLLLLLLSPLFTVAPVAAFGTLACGSLVIRQCWRLRKQHCILETEERLATPSSSFTRCGSVTLHSIGAQISLANDDDDAADVLCHFSHGFAANALTWEPFFAVLANAMPRARGLTAIAHDRPGFGLTSRPTQVEAYAEAACTAYALELLSHVMPSRAADESNTAATATEGGQRLVLLGHSLGCAQAIRMAVARPEAVRALVLLAPALMPCPKRWLDDMPPPLRTLLVACLSGARLVYTLSVRVASSLCQPIVQLIAVTVVRLCLFGCLHSPVFWRTMLAHAYADHAKLTQGMEWRYRWVTRVRDADRATMCYLAALARQQLYNLWPDTAIAGDRSEHGARSKVTAACSAPPCGHARGGAGGGCAPMCDDDAMWEALAAMDVPVLLVHGTSDRVIPLVNSRRLAASMPTATLIELDACGHNVHEECDEQLAEVVARFLEEHGVIPRPRVLGSAHAQEPH